MKFVSRYLISLILIISTMSAHALNKQPYSQALFDQLQAKGDVVLIDVYASWCSTCKKQQKAITAYQKSNPGSKFHILEVDYDKDKDVVRKFRAPRQSTLLLYKGDKQFWFSVAESRPQVIAAELNKAINFKAKK